MKSLIFPHKASTIQDRVAFIEKVVTRLARRTRKTAAALITPYPISNAVLGSDVRGSILRYMFPCEGVISKGFVRLGKKPKGEIKLTISVSNDSGGQSKEYVILSRFASIDSNIDVVSGDCLDISLNITDPEEKVTEIWVSFLWKPTVRDVEVKSYLINEIEDDIPEDTNE